MDEHEDAQQNGANNFADLDQFCIKNPREIFVVLRQLMTSEEPVTFRPLGHDGLILSSILDVDFDAGEFLFKCSEDSSQNQTLLDFPESFVSAMPNGIPVQFLCGQLQQRTFRGALVFCAALPMSVYKVQRRDAFRVGTPVGDPFICTAEFSDLGQTSFDIFDLSLTGIGLRSSNEKLSLIPRGVTARNAVLDFRKAGKLTVNIQIAYLQKIEGGKQLYRVGCRLIDFPQAKEPELQKLITYLELGGR
jgi:flagellar brake protein